jgi:hypothetical protein
MQQKRKYLLIVLILLVILPIISAANSVSLIRNVTWSANLSGNFYSSLALGDIDNDEDADIVSMGCLTGGFTDCTTADKIRIYINNGTTFNENSTWGQNTTNLGYGSLALGDIDNDGDLDFIAMGDQGGGNGIVKVFINNGSTFNENIIWGSNFSGINAFNGALALGDVDNDGRLDIVLAGAYPTDHNRVYINNGSSFIRNSNWLESLPLVGYGGGGAALIFGDYNNDGNLDLAFAGSRSTDFYTSIYINNGTSLVDNSSWKGDFTATFGFPSLAIGDYDNDGFTDLAAIGARAGDHLKFYNNTGSNFALHMENSGANSLGGYLEGSIAFGDIDNDGDLDFGAMGRESDRNHIYTNNNSIFERDIFEQQDMHDDDMQWGGLTWIDVDNDTNLDLIINGKVGDSGVYSFKVYLSNASLTKNNTLPTPPDTFTSNYSVTNNQLNLTWNNGSDNETPSTGLYYNLMIGNSSTNNTIVSGIYGGSSNPTAGYFGNMMQRKNITLDLVLPTGTYYWYVQTIDTGLAKSDWSERQSIVVGADITAPIISGVGSSVTTSTATITWTTDEMANSSVYYGTTISTTSSSKSAILTMSHSISLNGLTASTTYYYNVSSCDDSGNCNTSSQSSFTTSAETVTPPGGGGSSGGRTPKPVIVTPKEFDIDFSSSTGGILETKQGDVKTFSFNGEIKHSITLLSVSTSSMTLLITSEPITTQMNVGETKQIDINNDKINDFEINLISIISGKAKFSLTKLSGADIVAEEEIEKQIKKGVLFDVKVSLSNLFRIVKTGREVIVKVEVLNVNNIGQVDVNVNYYITSKEDNKTKLTEGSDTLAVEAVASFVRSLTVPYNLKAGRYLFNVDIKYQGRILASGSAEFIVIKTYEIFIAVGVVVLVIAGIFFYLWRIKRKEEKLEKKESRLERKIRILEGIRRWKKLRNKRRKRWQKQR